MLRFRIYVCIVIGTGLTLLIYFTLAITWLIGIMALMPGIALAGLVAPNASSPVPMLVANALVYSVAASPFVWLMTRQSKAKPNMLRAGVITAAITAIVVCGFLGNRWVEESGRGMCGNEVIGEVASPDGQQKAVTFVRNCGATTDFSTQVSVMNSSRHLNHADMGNVFAADSDHGAASVSGEGALAVSVNWKSQTQLEISYPRTARVFLKEGKYRDVSVHYESK